MSNFGTLNAYQDGPSWFIIGLLRGRFNRDCPTGEIPCNANTFLNKFLSAKGQCLAQKFRTPGRIYSTENMWWGRMVNFILGTFEDILQEFGFNRAIKNIRFGFLHNAYHLYSILEM